VKNGIWVAAVGGNKSAVPSKISPSKQNTPPKDPLQARISLLCSRGCPLTALPWAFPALSRALCRSAVLQRSLLHLPSAIPGAISYSNPRFLSHCRTLLGKTSQEGSIHWAQLRHPCSSMWFCLLASPLTCWHHGLPEVMCLLHNA